MRRRKQVLLFSLNTLTLDVTAYALGLRDFTILPAATEHEARELIRDRPLDVFVFICETHGDALVRELCLLAKRQQPEATSLVVFRGKECPWNFTADRILHQPTPIMATLRETLKILASRKPGPKKHVAAVTTLEREAITA